MKALIVIGLGFGDEGKGLATDFLCKDAIKPIVVRFNGGHQAGHTVVNEDGSKHTFSNFGSGTFRHVPTYWSSFCSFFPEGVISEFDFLNTKPKLLIDRDCTVTTHYDILYNRIFEVSLHSSQRGSCGLGYGATVHRNQFENLHFRVSELFDKNVCPSILREIRAYYRERINTETSFDFEQFNHEKEDKRFFNQIEQLQDLIKRGYLQVVSANEVFSMHSLYQTFIFEGAQGVLLDQNFGFFPYITKSNTTSQNAIDLIREYLPNETSIDVIYVTRCYHTRHGAGPFTASKYQPDLKNIDEVNVYNQFQRDFRISYLDMNMLNYALKCDSLFSKHINKHLIVTCLDQLMSDKLQCYKNGELISIEYSKLPRLLNCEFSTCTYSFSACSSNLEKLANSSNCEIE